jgi:putative ABC transport system permease protein
MLQDYKLGLRMLLKYPGLTIAGGLALTVAIGIGAGWYDFTGKLMAPVIPLPEGHRIVTIDTQNTLTNAPEPRVVRDFLEWRRELRTIDTLGAYREDTRNLIIGNAAPEPIHMAALTAAAFRTARVPPLLGRALLDSDEMPGAPGVIVLGYGVWQRSFGGRRDVISSAVKLGNTSATVIGVMPDGFGYPINHEAWTPLSLGTSYEALEGDAIGVIGRLAPGVTQDQANAELRVVAERTAGALPATHAHLRPRVMRLGEGSEIPAGIAQFAMQNMPVLLVLLFACTSVGTLIYARTATREVEIAVRSALGASRARIVTQLFVEALVLASAAAALGLVAADRATVWALGNIGDAPFWYTPGLRLTTIVYASVLAVIGAAMLSLMPALKATRAVQSHLPNRGAAGASLSFGRVWTAAMIAQVALTAMGIPAAMESATEAMRNLNIRAAFPSRDYLAARIEMGQAHTLAELERRIAQEPGVVAVTFADHAPGSGGRSRSGEVEWSGAGPAHKVGFNRSTVEPGFFEVFDRPIVSGRTFNDGDRSPNARTVIVNETFARAFARDTGSGSPIGARLRYSAASGQDDASAADKWFEIVGVVRDFGLNPDDLGREPAFVFHAAPAETISPLVMNVRVRGNPATLAARLPAIAATVDAGLLVRDSQPLSEWIRQRDMHLITAAGMWAVVTAIVLFLSALGIFSLMSVSVSRRTREIGVRAALGASPRHLLAGILSRAMALMGSGIATGGVLLLWIVAVMRPVEEIALYAGYLGVTSAVMLAACLLACIGPARRTLTINPTDALREA